MAEKRKVDVYQMVTDKILEQLENGEVPWHKPWTGTTDGAFNRISKKPYSLLNQLMLEEPGEYASFKQWTGLGGKIKKGSKSKTVVFWKVYKKEYETEDGEKKTRAFPVLRYLPVFHISCVEGVEPLEDPFKDKEVKPIKSADDIISDYVNREGIKFKEEKSNRAFYSPLMDSVTVPLKEQFGVTEEYYSTTFHELTHSTGHKSRLKRFTNDKAAAFGSETYSKEELVAEIGSAFLMNTVGIEIPKTFDNSVAYLQSWMKALKNDNKMIVSAASRAEKASNLILGVTPDEYKKKM